CSNEKLRKLIARNDKRFKDNAGPWTILHNMIEKILKPNGFVLYYQIANPDEPEGSPARYYQLTVSNEFWLHNGKDYGKICIGLDGKYDLNIDRAPVLSIVIENNASCGTPLAFALSNKKNYMTIRMAILAVKQNIPCNDNNCEHNWYYEDLHDAKGFKRVRPCSQNHLWNPYMMIDKHRPSKLGIEGLTCSTTNNFTKRIHRTIESNYSEKQTVLSFLERLYGIKLSRNNLTENSGQNNFEAGLVTLFNTQSIEQQNLPIILTSDQQRRLNKGRLYFLLNMVESTNHNDYYYVKQSKNSDIFISPYDDQIVEFTEETMKNLFPMINKLAENAIQEAGGVRPNYYIVNIITGECPLCLDYIWNGSLHDVCKHVHAARIYNDYLKSQNHDEFIENITCKFVTYFKNKQRVLPSSNDLNHHASSNYGVPSKPPAKPRKRNPLQMQLSNIPSNPLSNDSNLPLMKETCPFCDEILPDLMSDKMKLALDRINNKQESDRIDFCHTHFAELSIVPSGIANKYPLNINFDELPHRIHRFKDDLTEIINGNAYSYYLNLAKQVYQEVGHRKAATPMMLMSRFESLRPGYYGSKGAVLIANTLIDLFINTRILTAVKSYPLQSINYIQEVLVPETAMRLIFEDIGGNSSLETARNIMIASSDFSDYVHNCDNE
ncbi:12029_t:CDS:2, partial [Rhizophagus irregularis]